MSTDVGPFVLISMLGLGACIVAPDDDSVEVAETLDPDEGILATTNAAGRSGAFYLPTRDAGTPVPLLLGFHATGSDGTQMTSTFRDLAEANGFAIVAPDSRVSPRGEFTWEVGDHPGDVTPDFEHALDCIEELEARDDVEIAADRTLAAGHSGGASSAPYLATNAPGFGGFAVLHGGVAPGGLGDRLVRGWLSTGEDDDVRSPEHVQEHVDALRDLGFTDLTFRIYPGGHGIADRERSELIAWWLD